MKTLRYSVAGFVGTVRTNLGEYETLDDALARVRGFLSGIQMENLGGSAQIEKIEITIKDVVPGRQ